MRRYIGNHDAEPYPTLKGPPAAALPGKKAAEPLPPAPLGTVHHQLETGVCAPQQGSWVTLTTLLNLGFSIKPIFNAVALGQLDGYFRLDQPNPRFKFALADLPKTRIQDTSKFYVRIPIESMVDDDSLRKYVSEMCESAGVEDALLNDKRF